MALAGPECHSGGGYLVKGGDNEERSDDESVRCGSDGSNGQAVGAAAGGRGPRVVGMTRSGSKQSLLRELGATPVVADALDPDQVAEAVGQV